MRIVVVALLLASTASAVSAQTATTCKFGLLMSLNMLIETREGFDYTAADCAGWLREAGFSNTRVEPLTGPESMMVATK